ncbi:putative Leucyl phenylalanyl tRNA protein transferase [Trypanosoma vivax]|nr:putative Leucyl phenylalanyl tRNA protein transferase [Trypanosoma vivax]
MSVTCVPCVNYVDLFSESPFVVRKCEPSGWLWEDQSTQAFPLEAKHVSRDGKMTYTATLWALEAGRRYVVEVAVPACLEKVDDNASGAEQTVAQWSGPRHYKVTTVAFPGISRATSQFIINLNSVYRLDFLDCAKAQCKDYMYVVLPSFSMNELVFRLFYHSLFILPGCGAPCVCYIPNNVEGRYCIDLRGKCQKWRKSKKLRRLLSSGQYAVAVNRDAHDSLKLAQTYHSTMHGSTWLIDEFIDQLSEMSHAPQSGVRILCVELTDKGTGAVAAGCIGFSVGAVYHDFTMFTLNRTSLGVGTAITKVMGEALQECGYDLWCWGSRLSYMGYFESGYHARWLDKNEFFSRWGRFRDEKPTCSVEEYLCSGRGMLPPLKVSH